MTTGITCTVLIDGQRAADGSPGDNPSEPAILSDLKVTWGRSDTMSQPGVDSCSFSVIDQAAGSSSPGLRAFNDQYRTGRRVDVLARGESYPEPSVPTFVNPGFELADQTWSASAGTAVRSSARKRTGSWALAVRAAGGSSAAVFLAPGPFQPAGTNPDAWDEIPTTSVGQTWQATTTLWLPPGATATIRAAVYSGPYASAASIAGTARTVIGDGSWQTISAEHTVQIADRWVGIHVELSPTGISWDQAPPALAWDAVDPTWTWDDVGTMYLDDVQVISPAEGTGRSVLVFAGRITDLSAGWDDSAGCPLIEVVASGFTADLDNRKVGDEPWTVESAEARARRILQLAGLPIDIDVDATIAPILLSWRDVDSQGATGLLQQVASSVDGVLWPAVHLSLGAYLRLEDPSLRASLLQLAETADGTIVIVQSDPDAGLDLSACEILRDPVSWIQSVADVATRVSVGWQVQGLDDEGLPTTSEATVLLVDAGLEASMGTRAISASTQLQAEADAEDVGQRLLTRAAPSGWRAGGLTIDDEDVRPGIDGVAMLLTLLDGTSRIGLPLVLGELPDWSPTGESAGVYLEGGSYSFVEGRWVLELGVSASGGGLGTSAAWDELDPSWTWNDWDPAITWNDLRGVSAPL